MADLQSKYTKLATEFSKLRSQVPVLKKAVLDEQAKEEELRETIRERDATIRKYAQETDSLEFRNQQLSTRVGVLQIELDEEHARGKKQKQRSLFGMSPGSSKQSNAPASTNNIEQSVIGEELQCKIEENVRLHKKVFESDLEHNRLVMQLQDRLSMLEHEAGQHQGVLEMTMTTSKAAIEKLTEEKAMLEVKLQRQESDVRDAKLRVEKAEEKLKQVEEELGHKVEESTKIILDKIPFNDTKYRHLNALNIPTHDRKHQLRAKELVGQSATLVRELTQGLSNFHTYSEQRSRLYPADGSTEPLSTVNKKFCQYLHDNATYLRAMELSFRAIHENLKDDSLTTLETASGLVDFSCKFKAYVSYIEKVTPYQLLSIEEECAVSSCTSTLEQKNMDLHSAIKKFSAALQKLETYISLLAAQSELTCDHPRSNHQRFFELLSGALNDFHEVVKEVSKTYNAKVSLEHQLPTATEKLKLTDECVVSSLVSVVTCTGKFSTFMASNVDFFTQSAGYRTRGSSGSSSTLEGPKSNPVVNTFRQRSINYMSSITRPCPESVPYKTALQNRKTLLSSTESRESLVQQVTKFQDKIAKLEKEKEDWMLESQLLQIKYEKELGKVANFEKGQTNLHSGQLSTQTTSTPDNQNAVTMPTSSTTATMLGQVTTMTTDTPTDSSLRETLIKTHFSKRMSELTSQLQLGDSKALNFQAECRALHKRLALTERNKVRLQDELNMSNQSVTQLRDELQTTTRSYEGQLSMMSEHLASMNEKLASQKDEIDALRLQLQINASKSTKKGKHK